MAYKVTLFFTQQSSKTAGWSENFWNNATSFDSCRVRTDKMKDLLNAVHAAQVVFDSWRMTECKDNTGVPIFRKTEEVEMKEKRQGDIAAYGDGDYPTTALLLELKDATASKTRQWIRGIDDSCISKGGIYNPNPRFEAVMETWLKYLAASGNGWCIRKLKPSNEYKLITSLNVTTGIVTCKAHGMGDAGSSSQVRLKGFQSPKLANKIWTVTVEDADNFKLAFADELKGLTVAAKKPQARLMTYEFQPIQSAKIIRATSHKTGRPIRLLSGKSKSGK